MDFSAKDTAIVITDPQNDFLSPDGVTWGVVGQSITENGTVENLGALFEVADQTGMPVFVSPHYYFEHDHRWKFEGTLETLMHAIGMFDRPHALTLESFDGSGADWLEQYKPYINDGKTIIASPHKVYGPEQNDLDLQLRKRMQIELRSLHRRLGTTFLFVTHDQEEALTMSDRIAVMNDGAVIQFDTPSAVYHHPATRFVAAFVGESTLLACKVLGRNGPRIRVQLACGGAEVTTANRDAGLAEGARTWLMLRPERMRVTVPTEGRVSGRLEDVFFLGWSYRHLVRLDDGVQAKADAEHIFEAGADGRVGLDWDADAAVPVAEPS